MTTKTPTNHDNAGETAPKGGPDRPPPDPGFEIEITYNGVTKSLRVRPKDKVSAVIEEARPLFGSPGGELVLVNQAGQELAPDSTLHEMGVKPHDKLLLRPRTVRGG